MRNKILFETMSGSYLYGTSRPESDLDYMGVFMPLRTDLLSTTPGPQEIKLDKKISDGPRNNSDDVDRKLFSLPKFMKLAGDGQSQILEMLFAPAEKWISTSSVWNQLIENRDLFVSQQSIVPFLGFATAQAHKATLKAGNLNKIRAVIKACENIFALDDWKQYPLIEDWVVPIATHWEFNGAWIEWTEVEYRTGVKMPCIQIAGKKFEFKQSVKHLYQKLREYESRYGTRSEAAAAEGHDFKSLMHAYRLLFEAEDILTRGKLELPFDKNRIDFLMSIRRGEYIADYFEELEQRIQSIKLIKSSLPSKVNFVKINSLCENLIWETFKEYYD